MEGIGKLISKGVVEEEMKDNAYWKAFQDGYLSSLRHLRRVLVNIRAAQINDTKTRNKLTREFSSRTNGTREIGGRSTKGRSLTKFEDDMEWRKRVNSAIWGLLPEKKGG